MPGCSSTCLAGTQGLSFETHLLPLRENSGSLLLLQLISLLENLLLCVERVMGRRGALELVSLFKVSVLAGPSGQVEIYRDSSYAQTGFRSISLSAGTPSTATLAEGALV